MVIGGFPLRTFSLFGANMMPTHRAGPLKQQNKSHKHGKHKSKSTLEGAFKGRSSLVVDRMITLGWGAVIYTVTGPLLPVSIHQRPVE